MTNNLESFQTVWKLSGNFEKFSESLESFWTIWKIFGRSGKFPDSLKGFWTVWKYAGHSGKFPDGLLSFRRIWKVVGRSGRFPYKTCSRFDTSPKENSPWETYGFPWEKLYHRGRRRRLPRDLTSPKGKKQTEPTSPKEPSNQTICTSPKGLPPNYTNVSQDDTPNHLYISQVI